MPKGHVWLVAAALGTTEADISITAEGSGEEQGSAYNAPDCGQTQLQHVFIFGLLVGS